MTITNNSKAITGAIIAIMDITTVPTDSTNEIAGLATPPEATVDPACTTLLTALVNNDVPPPPIAATNQVREGFISPISEYVKIVPAAREAGMLMAFRALSTQGIMYARSSTRVATANITKAG